MTYKLINNEEGNLSLILRTVNGVKTWIPLNEANTDYQEYLEWLAEGNTPEEAE